MVFDFLHFYIQVLLCQGFAVISMWVLKYIKLIAIFQIILRFVTRYVRLYQLCPRNIYYSMSRSENKVNAGIVTVQIVDQIETLPKTRSYHGCAYRGYGYLHLADRYQRCGETCCIQPSQGFQSCCSTLKVEREDSPEPLAPEYQITLHYNPQDCNL
jgi:hypothetical protein